MAGALAIRLGGPSIYHGQLVEKPFIGNGSDTPVTRHIYQAVDLMLLAAFLATVLACLGLFVFGPAGL
jgi:adenosylcobinamide-phosphate synthase